MLKMSFYDGTLNTKILTAFIGQTDKDIRYTYGLSYYNPSTNKKLITKKEAHSIVNTQSLLDANEEKNTLYLNAYSPHDMY